MATMDFASHVALDTLETAPDQAKPCVTANAEQGTIVQKEARHQRKFHVAMHPSFAQRTHQIHAKC
jgi:hypothetical protein